MLRNILLTASVLFMMLQSAHGEEAAKSSEDAVDPSGGDNRQLVSMPDEARKLMRDDMLGHLSALTEIMGYLATGNLDAAADVAETRMGRSSMGKHRTTGMAPGRFMPLEMRNIGWSMHDAASEFSKFAKQGDVKSAYSALQKVTGSCTACHYSYRTR